LLLLLVLVVVVVVVVVVVCCCCGWLVLLVVVLLLVDIARVVVTKNETQHPQKKMSIQSIYAWLWHLLGKMISHYPGKRPKQCGGSKRIMYYQVHDDVNFDDNVDDDDDAHVDDGPRSPGIFFLSPGSESHQLVNLYLPSFLPRTFLPPENGKKFPKKIALPRFIWLWINTYK
jgi:hypothetical protein